MAEVIGLSLLMKGVSRDMFEFMVKMGISCSYVQVLKILMKQKNPVEDVRTLFIHQSHS